MGPLDVIEERYERFAGYRTRVLRVAGDGPPLLLLHGFTDSADTWRPALRLLAGPHFAVDYAAHVAPRLARRRLITLLYGQREEALVSPLRLERIRCPAMVVWGEKDPLTPPAAAQSMVAAVPGLRTEVLPGIGHMPRLEAPARLVELVNEFTSAQR